MVWRRDEWMLALAGEHPAKNPKLILITFSSYKSKRTNNTHIFERPLCVGAENTIETLADVFSFRSFLKLFRKRQP